MKQYAIEGYSVDAVGFLVKPIAYEQIAAVLKRTVRTVEQNLSNAVPIKVDNEYTLIDASLIEFIEAKRHLLSVHTLTGIIQATGTMRDMIGRLGKHNFICCNSCTIINAKHIRAVRADTVILSSAEIMISKRKKAEFIEAYLRYAGNLGRA